MTEWLLILLTILLSGFFSGSEIAFVTANKLKLEIASRRNSIVAKAVGFFVQNPKTFMTTTLVGNNIVNVAYATLMAIFLADPISIYYEQIFGIVPGAAEVLIVQTIIASIVIMLFGEILPKAIFRVQADFLIVAIAIPIRVFYWLLRPLISLANASSQVVIKLFNPDVEKTEIAFGRKEIEIIFQELRESGGGEDLDMDDSEILHNVLELSTKRVKDSMIPRTEIIAVDKEAKLSDIRDLFIQSGYSKIPVYDETIDNIIGIVFAHDLFKEPKNLKSILRPVTLVPSSKKAKDLMAEFRKNKISVAVVIDEYGGTAGMVTIEDLVEEVVGDIQDEYDTDDHLIKKINDNTYVLSANVELDELMERHPEIEIPLEPSDYDTVAGYIINHLGRIPKVNEELEIEGHKIIISKASPNRLETIRLTIID